MIANWQWVLTAEILSEFASRLILLVQGHRVCDHGLLLLKLMKGTRGLVPLNGRNDVCIR
jgi:hypothetical protein